MGRDSTRPGARRSNACCAVGGWSEPALIHRLFLMESIQHTRLMSRFEVPALVRRRALAMGDVGAAWLEGLDETVARVAAEWDLQAGRVLDGRTWDEYPSP